MTDAWAQFPDASVAPVPIAPVADPYAQFQDATPAPVQQPMAPSQQQPPATWRQQLMAGPVGQAMGGAMQGIYGADQLAYKGAGALASLGGYYPNPVSAALNNTADSVGQQAQQEAQSYQDARTATGKGSFNPGKFIGEVASPVNALAGEVELPGAVAAMAPKAAKLANILLKGAAYGSTAPVSPTDDYASTKLTQAGIGAGIGAGASALGAVANPMASLDPKVATLLKAGVPLTVGQTLGGPVRTIEDSATSIPVVGDIVKARQRDAMAGLNTAVINRSLAPIGETLPSGTVGHAAIQYAQGKLGDAYDALLPKLSATADPQLTSDLGSIVNNAAGSYGLNKSGQQQLYDILHGQIVQKSNNGNFDGNTLKDIQSNLSFQAQRFIKSPDPDQKNLGDALFDAKSAFNDFIARHNPTEAPQLQAINQGWANFARAQGAAAASKTGIFTPAELGRAVKAGGTKGTNAAGTSLMQDLSTAGQSILPSTVPDSGTAGRHFVDLALGALAGGGEHLATGDAGIGVLSGGAALGLGATKPAQWAMRTALTKRPYSQQTASQLGAILARGAPRLAAPVAVPALTQNSN